MKLLLETRQRWALSVHLPGLEAVAGLEEAVCKMVVGTGGRSVFTFSSSHCPAGAHLPLPRENQPHCQKPAVITDSHAACRQTGHRANFQLGIRRTRLVEFFHGVCGWVRKVGERAEVSRVELCSPRAGRALAPFLLLPSAVPFAASCTVHTACHR